MCSSPITAESWHIPLSVQDWTLGMAYAHLQQIGLRQEQIPFIVQLIENPRFELPGIEIFPGATDLPTHDCIHILLGRGLDSIDEAFVLGYTMGSTNRLNATEEALYTFFARNFYPEGYKFGDDEVRVFRDAVRLAYITGGASLAEVDYRQYDDKTLKELRQQLGIDEGLLRAYYSLEKKRFPTHAASQRLLA
jgi:hypothetical protein